jgi:O-antigen/teichoic acid export membrane protein
MVNISVLTNLFNLIVIFFLEKINFHNSIKKRTLIKKFEFRKIIPSYFLNTLSNYIFEWSIFFVFFILNLKNQSDIFFAAMQAKFFISFFGIAFIRKYIYDFSINLKENNINKLNKILKIFNKYIFKLSIIVLVFFILFNKEFTLFMYKSSLSDINIMCLLFIIIEFVYLLFGCPQSIGMLSKHDYFFSKINFVTSIFYFVLLFATIHFLKFGVQYLRLVFFI